MVEVQGGLHGEASSEVDVADAGYSHGVTAAAVYLVQVPTHVTRESGVRAQLQPRCH